MPTDPTALLTAASALIRLAHPDDASLARALVKAEARLMTHPWRYANNQLEITSASHPNEIHVAGRSMCTCEARRLCWHIAGVWLINAVAAAGVELVPALELPNMQLIDDYANFDAYGSFLDEPIVWSVSE